MATATRYVEGSRIARLIGEGFVVTEAFIVPNAVGATPAERLYDALQATNLPTIGDLHGTIPNVFLSELSGAPAGAGADKVTVIAVYKAPEIITAPPDPATDPGTIYNAVALQDVETKYDRAGNQIVLTKVEGAETLEQPGNAALQIPVIIRGVERRELADPTPLADQYVGKVNFATIWGQPARRWLCTRIDGTSTDYGDTYTVNYEFQRSELLPHSPTETYSSWDALVIYEDEEGRPIKDPVLGESKQIIEIYDEADFSLLNLPA